MVWPSPLSASRFHQGVAVVAADAHAEEGDAVLAAGVGDAVEDRVGLRVARVGERVRDQHDPVGGALAQALDCGGVAGAHACAEVGRLGRFQFVDRVVDAVAVVVEAGHRQDGLGLVAEGDDGHRVVVAQPVRHHAEGVLGEVEAAGLGHGAGDVDDEGEGGRRAFTVLLGGAGGEAHADQGPVLAVGAGAVDGDREAVAVGAFVVLAEAVDELLRPDRRRVGAVAVGEGAARVAVRGGVDVEGEGGEVVGGRGELPVRLALPLAFASAPVAVLLLAGATGLGGRGCVARASAGVLPTVRLAVLAAVAAGSVAAAAGEQQAARGRHRDQRTPQASCSAYPVPLHLPCPLRPLTSDDVNFCDCDGGRGRNVRYGVLRMDLEVATTGGHRDR